jgi:long-chain fatty acid transport protein
MNMTFKKLQLSILGLALLTSSHAFASGFEKSIMWGGRTAGVGGVATPYITGSQALYFNPAGIVNDAAGMDVSFNLSPTLSQFKGPINNQNEVVDSKQELTTPFGLIYNATLDDKWGFAVGGYSSGGAISTYENVTMTGFKDSADVFTDLKILEVAAGVGYRFSPELTFGAAYRMVIAEADFAVIQRSAAGTSFTNIKLNELKDTDYTGFKAGAQYKMNERTMIGLSYRSEVSLEAEGTLSGKVVPGSGAPSPVLQLDSRPAKAKTVFPQAATLGVWHNLSEIWNVGAEYVWTQYSRVDNINIEGDISIGGAVQTSSSQVQQNWKDQHNVRLGAEYLSFAWPVRAGYVWTSQVTDEAFARPTFTPPGDAHTFTLGTGTKFEIYGSPLQFDTAAEITTVSADGGTAAAGATTGDSRQGNYRATAAALHLGLTMAF